MANRTELEWILIFSADALQGLVFQDEGHTLHSPAFVDVPLDENVAEMKRAKLDVADFLASGLESGPIRASLKTGFIAS